MWVQVTPRPAASLTALWPSGSKSAISAKRRTRGPLSEHLVSAGRQCVSFSSLLQSPALSAREKTTYSERKTRHCDAPDLSSSRRLSSPSRDVALYLNVTLARRSRVPSILRANLRRWLPNGLPPTRSSLSHAHTMTTTHASTIRACTRPLCPVGPRWTYLAVPADMTGQLSGNGSSSSPVPIVHGEECQTDPSNSSVSGSNS